MRRPARPSAPPRAQRREPAREVLASSAPRDLSLVVLLVLIATNGPLVEIAREIHSLIDPFLLAGVSGAVWWARRRGRGAPLPVLSERLAVPLAFALFALVSLALYRMSPLSRDEWSMGWQAAVFAGGHLTGSLPPGLADALVPPSIQNWFLLVDHTTGATLSPYWPGWSALLAPFAALGVTWLAGPLVGALTVGLIGRTAARLGGAAAASPARLFALVSPSFVLTSASTFPAVGHLALNLAWLLLVLRGGRRAALLAGLAGSLALVLHNPAPHALFALPWLVWRARERRWRELAPLATGYLPGLALLAGWPLLRAALIADPGSAIPALNAGFLPTPDSLFHRALDLAALWIWAMPGLALLAWRGLRANTHPEPWLLAGSLAVTFAFHLCYPNAQGHGWGARYLHSAWAALPILAALWWVRTSEAERPPGRILVGAGSLLVALALTLGSLYGMRDAFRPPAPPPAGQAAFVAPAWRADLLRPPIRVDPAGGPWLFVSAGPEADAALVERRWPGAVRLSLDADGGSRWRLPAP